MEQNRYQITRKVTLFSALSNTLLAIGKVVVGYLGSSHALVADGVHSFSDLITDALVVMAAKAGGQEPDKEHPYGHRRIETIAAIIIAILLIIVAGLIVYDAIEHLALHKAPSHPELIVLIVAVFSVLANEWLFRYTKRWGETIKSNLLISNAYHHRGDALSSIIVFIAAGGAMLGLHFFDAVGAALIGLLILKMGVQMMLSGVRELIDTAVDPETLVKIRAVISNVPGVQTIHQLRTRSSAGNIFVDVHIIVDPFISVSEGHHIGEQVHLQLMKQIEHIADVVVHIDPEDDSKSMPSIGLPTRKEIEKKLRNNWQNLPGYQNIKRITLHYLEGKLYVEVFMPLSAITPIPLNELTEKYQRAAINIADIESITINLMPE